MPVKNVVGKSVPRQEAREKVTGAAKFVDDLQFGNKTLLVKVLRSPHAHAKILRIDASAALKVPGVKAVVTGQDVGRSGRIGLYLADREVYASDRVRFVPIGLNEYRRLEQALRAGEIDPTHYLNDLPSAVDTA